MDTTLESRRRSRTGVHPPAAKPGARIGPNAVTRTLDAVTERLGASTATALRLRAGIPDPVPATMIPERWFVRLVSELRATVPEPVSAAILRQAGEATAAYVAQNRVPAPARAVLAVLPSRLALPMLLRAVDRHAWTFAGRGDFRHADGTLTLSDAPTCRASADAAADPLDHPPSFGGAYYEAAFAGILALASPDIVVREVACVRAGAPACRFRLERSARAADAVRDPSATTDVTPVFARSS